MAAGCVYFIQADGNGYIKIGWTSGHPDVRLRDLIMMSPVRLVPLGVFPGPLSFEARLHARFAGFRTHGEWFRPEAPLLGFIKRWAWRWPDPTFRRNPGCTRETIDLAGAAKLMRVSKGRVLKTIRGPGIPSYIQSKALDPKKARFERVDVEIIRDEIRKADRRRRQAIDDLISPPRDHLALRGRRPGTV